MFAGMRRFYSEVRAVSVVILQECIRTVDRVTRSLLITNLGFVFTFAWDSRARGRGARDDASAMREGGLAGGGAGEAGGALHAGDAAQHRAPGAAQARGEGEGSSAAACSLSDKVHSCDAKVHSCNAKVHSCDAKTSESCAGRFPVEGEHTKTQPCDAKVHSCDAKVHSCDAKTSESCAGRFPVEGEHTKPSHATRQPIRATRRPIRGVVQRSMVGRDIDVSAARRVSDTLGRGKERVRLSAV